MRRLLSKILLELLNREDQIIVVVVGTRVARGRASLVAEIRSHGLQTSSRKGERS